MPTTYYTVIRLHAPVWVPGDVQVLYRLTYRREYRQQPGVLVDTLVCAEKLQQEAAPQQGGQAN